MNLGTIKSENPNDLSSETGKVRIEETGSTRERVQGYVEGERYRRQRLPLS